MTLAERAAEVIELYDAKHTAVVYGDSSRLTVAPDGYHVHSSHGGLLDAARHASCHGGGLRRHPSGLRRTLPNSCARPAAGLRQPMFNCVLPTKATCGPSL